MRFIRHENGFTLVEVLIAVVLIGLAIASLLGGSMSITQANGAGVKLSIAEFLIEQIKERTTLVSYDDLYGFDGVSFSPPIGVNGENLDNFAAYSQHVVVENVAADDFEQVVGDYSSSFVRVSVEVFVNSNKISSANWIRASY